MRQKLYFLGLLNLLMIFAGVFLKINHLAGAGILITCSIFMLVFIFLPPALYDNYRNEGKRLNGLLYVITWITCLVVFGSMLFKIMHWPGAGTLMLIALPFPFVVYLPVYLYFTSKINNYSIYNTVFVLFLLVYLAVFSSLLALNVSKEKINQSLVFTETYQNMKTLVSGDPFTGSQGDSRITDPRIEAAAEQALKSIAHCRELIKSSYPSEEKNLPESDVTARMLDSRTLAARVLLVDDKRSPAADLEKKLRNFEQVLKDATGDDTLVAYAGSILMLNPDENPDPWVKRRFENNYLSWVLIYLESLETNVNLLMQQAMEL